MNIPTKTSFFYFPFLFFLYLTCFCNAQNTDNPILDKYELYSEAPREVIYAHLNKSIFIKGEMLGLSIYAFDKYDKALSSLTTNIYCTIEDTSGAIIKKKLLHVSDGTTKTIFRIDSTFNNGSYTIKAFTNWQKNFPEQNHFQQNFKVISDNDLSKNTNHNNNDIDLQILGEGGHIIENTLNTVGIIAKDKNGIGLANVKGEIVDDLGELISNFKLNSLGISKILFQPLSGRLYFTKIHFKENIISAPINNIKPYGINLSVTERKSGASIILRTNKNTLNRIKDKNYSIGIHNGKEISKIDFRFDDLTQQMIISNELLHDGMNIITVFDENLSPLLERMVFKDKSVSIAKLNLKKVDWSNDSIRVVISSEQFDSKLQGLQNISISVLPEKTISYNHQNNIISQLFLQPYIKSPVQNAQYYFNNVTAKTKFDLDLLLLTQGWSSYSWDNIFKFNTNYIYNFEQGIDVTANINGKNESSTFITYPLKNSSTQVFSVDDTIGSFTIESLVPVDNETLRIGILEKNSPPPIYTQFNPSTFPNFNFTYPSVDLNYSLEEFSDFELPKAWENAEQLKEVVIKTKYQESEIEKKNNKRVVGKLIEITDLERKRATPLSVYLNQIGFVAHYDYANGEFTIINPRVQWKDPVPLVYLNDAPLLPGSFNILSFLTLETIDYLEVEFYGTGGSFRAQAGYIKIYTSENLGSRNNASNAIIESKFPLSFEGKKEFYTPKFQDYNTKFFQDYGAISWYPDLKVDSEGNIVFSFIDTGIKNISLYIEGITKGNHLISQNIQLKL
ncbi:hypothetical protein [Winogradskyella sp. A3E31]|uniref:hypothetical protein n=1 Tax=Winogradskyella sp. A3E31 TaxID=3349637 RepID=UPI00398B9380